MAGIYTESFAILTSFYIHRTLKIRVVQSLSHVGLSVSPGTAVGQATLSSTVSWSLLKFMSIDKNTL